MKTFGNWANYSKSDQKFQNDRANVVKEPKLTDKITALPSKVSSLVDSVINVTNITIRAGNQCSATACFITKPITDADADAMSESDENLIGTIKTMPLDKLVSYT